MTPGSSSRVPRARACGPEAGQGWPERWPRADVAEKSWDEASGLLHRVVSPADFLPEIHLLPLALTRQPHGAWQSRVPEGPAQVLSLVIPLREQLRAWVLETSPGLPSQLSRGGFSKPQAPRL